MEHEKYIVKKDNCFVVHFPNNKGLSVAEVREMFSAFGNVLSVDNRGKIHGLCFVKYETAEDAISCINGFKNHKYIKILPHINKLKLSNVNNRNPYTKDKGMFHHPSPKGTLNDSSFESVSTENQSDSKSCINKSKVLNVQRKKYNKIKGIFDQSFRSNPNNRNLKNKPIDNRSDSSISILFVKDRDTFKYDTVDGENGIKYDPPISSLKHFVNPKNLRRIGSNTSVSSRGTNDMPKSLEELFDESEIPPLIPIDQKYQTYGIKASSSPKVIPAQELIVANIHPAISIHYILHLFEKYNPISVSFMMTAPKTGLRYCYVYYKALEEANATMEEFDTYHLRGRNLIVLTSQKLMKESFY